MDAAFFEGGTDDEGVAGGGEGPGEEAFGLAGRNAEEVLEGGAAGDGEGGEFVPDEELAGAVDALLALGGGDGDGLMGAVFEGEDGGGEIVRGGRGLGVQVGRVEGEGGRGDSGSGEESAAREHAEIVG